MKFEDEKLELERGWTQTTKDQTKVYVILVEVLAPIAKKVKKSTARNNAPVLTESVENQLIDGLKAE